MKEFNSVLSCLIKKAKSRIFKALILGSYRSFSDNCMMESQLNLTSDRLLSDYI